MQINKRAVVVKPTDSFDHWHQVTCRDFSLTECRRIPDHQFRAQIAIRDFGSLKVNNIWSRTSPDQLICVERSESDTRRDPRDYFMLWLTLGGEIVFTQGGRTARMKAGDLTLHDQAQPFKLEFAETSHSLMISIPRPMLIARLSDAARLTARTIDHASRLGSFTGSMVRQLVDLDEDREDVVERLSASTLDVLATALAAELAPSATTGQDKRLDDVKRFMLARLEASELTPDSVATAQNMSPRTLNRLFALDGTTPMRWLWEQRLAASHRALTLGEARHVTDAAFRFGFSDVSHFSRAFRAKFGCSPNTVRRR